MEFCPTLINFFFSCHINKRSPTSPNLSIKGILYSNRSAVLLIRLMFSRNFIIQGKFRQIRHTSLLVRANQSRRVRETFWNFKDMYFIHLKVLRKNNWFSSCAKPSNGLSFWWLNRRRMVYRFPYNFLGANDCERRESFSK